MSSVKSHTQVIVLVLIVVVLLSGTVLSGCSRKQYTQHRSSIVLDSNRLNKINTYLFNGIKHYIYDSTIVVVNTTGDTIRTDHRSDSRYYQETQEKIDTVYIEIIKTDTIYSDEKIVVKYEMSNFHRVFFYLGVLFVLFVIYKIINLFKV